MERIKAWPEGRNLTITIPIAIPKELNPNWQLKDTAAMRGLKARAINKLKVFALIYAVSNRNLWERTNGQSWLPLERATIEVTVIRLRGARKWDETNVRAALKSAEDMLTPPGERKNGAGIIRDDRPACLEWLPIKWERGAEAGIRIEINERTN